jgi:hypothetical protein
MFGKIPKKNKTKILFDDFSVFQRLFWLCLPTHLEQTPESTD